MAATAAFPAPPRPVLSCLVLQDCLNGIAYNASDQTYLLTGKVRPI
jgi:glutamine cyclotransferase